MNTSSCYAAIQDLSQGLKSWRIWLLLGWQDIHLRYRRSTLGPLWITLSMAAMIYAIGFLYGKLFKVDLSVYYPYLATGMVIWALISGLLTDGVEALIHSSGFIKQIPLPYSIYIFRLLTHNFFLFLHNLIAIIPILWFFDVPITPFTLLVFLCNLFILFLCGFVYVLPLSFLGARFRDIKPILVSFLQIFFFLTPILWMPDMLPERFAYLAQLNPFYQFVLLLREPLTGKIPDLFSYVYISLTFILGAIITLFSLYSSRHRVAFWL